MHSHPLFVGRTHHRLWTVYCTIAYSELHWGIVVQSSSVEDGPSSAGICNVRTLPRYHPKTRAEPRAETFCVSNTSMKSVEIPTGNRCGCPHRTWSHLDYCELSLRIAVLERHTEVMISLSMHTTRSAKRAVWVLRLRYATPSVISRHNSGSANWVKCDFRELVATGAERTLHYAICFVMKKVLWMWKKSLSRLWRIYTFESSSVRKFGFGMPAGYMYVYM
jgi:hypothetical protein